MDNIPACDVCGQKFDNIFDATDHLVEDGGEQRFDPRVKLPGGYSLMLGSLLRELFYHADDPDTVKRMTEMTYATLYAAENDTSEMKYIVEESIVRSHMSRLDEELKEILDGEDKNDNRP